MTRRLLTTVVLAVVASLALASLASAQMVGQWHMDEATGTSTPDASGSNLPLTTSTGAAVQIAPDGRFANQLGLANTSVLFAPVSPILQPAQVTLIAWARLSGPAPALKYIAGLGDDGPGTCLGSSYAMYTGVSPSTGLFFYIRTPGTTPVGFLSASPGNTVWDGNWHMLAGTYDGANVHLYVDGVEIGSPTPTGGAPIEYNLGGGQTFYVDGYPQPTCGIGDFPGGIDEVRVYNRALTQNEIARLAAWPGPDAPPALIVDPPPPPPPPPATPVPVANKSVVVTELKGRVLVRVPGSKRFVDVSEVRLLPLGTVVNATGGRIQVTAAADNKGATQTAIFYDGIFKIGQTGPASRLTTVMTLVGEKPSCPKAKSKAKRGRTAKKAKARRLWGDGKGRFQTKGQYSSATVRGTKWLVEDNCKGTLTKVARGSVTVRDFVKDKTVIVKAGKSYLAKRSR